MRSFCSIMITEYKTSHSHLNFHSNCSHKTTWGLHGNSFGTLSAYCNHNKATQLYMLFHFMCLLRVQKLYLVY